MPADPVSGVPLNPPEGSTGSPSPSPHGRDEAVNPYRDHLFARGLSQASTQVAEGAWDEGFAACRAAFDAVVAERDREARIILECLKFARDETAGYWGKEQEAVYQRFLSAVSGSSEPR